MQNQPKAIFFGGPSGSGKSYTIKRLPFKGFEVINSDDVYEELLKKSGIGLNQKNFTPEKLSLAAKLNAQARKETQEKLIKSMEGKINLVIDGTGGSVNPILKKKQELETLGYKCMWVMLYV